MSKRICRLCLAYTSVCFSLLENNISEMLEALTSIKVTISDMTSTVTCTKCLVNLRLAFKIQQNFLKSNEKLREVTLLDDSEVKLEIVDRESEPSSNVQIGMRTESPYFEDVNAMLELCCSDCLICGISVEGNLLTKHVQAHFNDEQTCDFCNKQCSNITEYENHMRHVHKQDKYVKHLCRQCGVVFHYKSLYNVHIRKAHCDESNVLMASKPSVGLLLEPKLKKQNQGLFVCDICRKEFKYKRQLMNHTHQRKKCRICGANITKNNFNKHLKNHSSGPQICELCGACLRSLESLRGHLAHTHSTMLYNCEDCGKVYRKRYTYLLHKKKHSGEKAHICETCGKSFLTLYYLNKHIKTAHLKLRPYVCEYCNKAFSSKFAVRTHMRQHTNETPYRCEVCGEGFRQNVSLRAHRKSKHNIIEPKTCACTVCGKLFGSDHAVVSHMRLH